MKEINYIEMAEYTVFVILIILFAAIRWVAHERTMLRKLAYRDEVTGLLNRNGLEYFWRHYCKNEDIAILCLDLDLFKKVNDTYGHQVGDRLLREVSQDLRQVTNKDQKVFRTGGDEFIFIMKNCDRAKVEIIAGLILEQISRPYTIEGINLNITGSIGISMSRARYVERDKMIEQADTAMYCAKRMGKNRYSIYRESRHRYLKAIELTLAQR